MALIYNGESYVDDGIAQTPQYWNGSTYVDDTSAGAKYLQGATGQYQNAPKTRDFVNSLLSGGMTTTDLDAALKSYMGSTGATDSDKGWWGDQALLRAFGTGLDATGKTSNWQNFYDASGEAAQQKELAVNHDTNQANQGNDWSDLGDILKGVSFVMGAGGLANAFGSSIGLPGADVIGSDWASGLSSAMNSGGAAASTVADATWGANPRTELLDSITTGLEGTGNAATNAGSNDMSWLDDLVNSTGSDWNTGGLTGADQSVIDFGSSLNDVAGLPSGLDALDVPGGLDSTIAQPSGWDSVKSLLSQGKNIPTSLVKSLFGTDDATSASIAKLIGTGLGGLLDYNASSKSAEALKEIADRSWNAGQPYRDRANAAMTPGFDVKSIPGLSSAMDTATDTYLRRLSATNGNPAGVGGAPSQTQAFVLGNVALPAWQNYFNANSNAGGLSNLSADSSKTATQAAMADGGVYGSLGQTARNIFDPQPNYQKQYLDILSRQLGLA
jgi:hypothetical protein